MKEVTKAMILAAGFGTRLRPLTDTIPKPLIPYNGKPMIENAISKLVSAGVNEFIINTHHHADKMAEYFENRKGPEHITLVRENEILGTGGALLNAREYLEDSGSFFLYNADVDTDADLLRMEEYHLLKGALATLALNKRETSRHLIVDNELHIVGRTEDNSDVVYRQSAAITKFGFCGIHLISDRLFKVIESTGNFDIIPEYMRLISCGYMINGFDIGTKKWQDLGKYFDGKIKLL